MAELLVDIGLNLGNARFRRDRDAVVARALAAGVTRMVLTGTSVPASEQALALALAHPGVLWSTAGVHPHDASRCGPRTLDALRRLAASPTVVAIGECGLDFNRDFSPRPVQERWFSAQIELACERQMPLFLHERDAAERMLVILSRFGADLPPAVIHCFTGSAETLGAYLELGLHVGITGWICDERRGEPLQRAVSAIPLDRLLVETDAPYLTPRDLTPKPKGGRNEPAFLPHITRAVAHHMGHSFEAVARASTANAVAFFGLG
ncbi:MAG: TatD family hydrolase [Myxococcota bacterium]|nr:TatD family hydrolase [Myxococcota bacterium]